MMWCDNVCQQDAGDYFGPVDDLVIGKPVHQTTVV
jgi:hypothetical protein